MRRARLLVAVLVFGAAFQVGSAPSGAAELTTAGWWWRAQAGAVSVPSPPHVPPNGLAVGQAPDGPSAVAAVRFALQAEELDPVLTLQIAREFGGAGLVACASKAPWFGTQGGPWRERPEAVCGPSAVKGAKSQDGKGWIFPLGALYTDGLLDVVIVPAPGSAPFEISFEAPTDASLQTTRAPAPSDFESGFDSTASDGDDGFAPPNGGFDGGVEFGRPLTPSFPPAVEPGEAAPGDPPPSGDRQDFVRIARSPSPASEATDPRRLAVVILLAALVIATLLGREPLPPPRLLGPMAGRREAMPEESEERGLGRFRRARGGTPPALH